MNQQSLFSNFSPVGEIVGHIYQTTDYSIFRIMEKGNRPIDKARVKALVKSMRSKYLHTIILVNDRYEIIDGQHRFMAIKSLGLPLRYTFAENYGISETRGFNQNVRGWTRMNIIQSYAAEGVESYARILEFKNRYPYLTENAVLTILQQNSAGLGKEAFNKGEFEIPDYEKSCEIADLVMAYKGLDIKDGYLTDIFSRREFAVAISKLVREAGFTKAINDEIVRKIKAYPSRFYPCLRTCEYIKMLESIYNYKRLKPNKIYFNV